MSTDHSRDTGSPEAAELVSRIACAFEHMPVPQGPSVRETMALLAENPAPSRRAGSSRRVRLALGGLGLSSAAAVALLLFSLNSGRELSAMERMARGLQEIKSYSYKVSSENTFYEDGAKVPTIVREEGIAYWMAPDAFHDETKIIRSEVSNEGKRTEEVVVDFAQVFPTGKLGLFIDNLAKTYRWLPNEPYGSVTFPWETLRLIRANSGEVVRELGARQIGGHQARGYVITLKGWRRARGQLRDSVEVWVEAATDLPLEFSYRGKHEEPDQRGAGYWMRATDFRWNADVDPDRFEPRPPAGYTDIGPPERAEDLQSIVDALTLYAELSGGHYPRVEKFDAGAIHEEMLKLAGFIGPERPAWQDDADFRRINDTTAGLKWIDLILRNRYHSGYEGVKVGPADKEKPLLWWTTFGPEQFQVIYGDLRCESLSAAAGQKLGLGWEAAAERERPDEPR